MTNIFKCRRCKIIFIQEEFDNHVCTPHLTDVKSLEFDYYDIMKDELNRDIVTIKSMDGILFRFIKREMKQSDKETYLPMESQQPNKTPDDSTEPIFAI